MSLKPKKKMKSIIPPLEAGTYTATCIGVIDLDEQYNEKYKKYEDKVLLIFEIADEYVEQDGEQKPRWLRKECTNTVNEKSNLYKYISAFIGQLDDEELDRFDPSMLLGKSAFAQISIEKSKTSPDVIYNDIASITQLPKKMKPPEPESSIMLFDFDDWNDEVFNKLPEWIQKKIKNSPTYQKMGQPPEKVEFDDNSTEPSVSAEPPKKADF